MNICVLGASRKPERYSYQAVRLLREKGHAVFPVHPTVQEIDGISVFKRLRDIPEPIHTITMYIGADRSNALADEILGARPKRVIFNPGAENPDLARQLDSAGIEVLDACTLVLLKTGQFDPVEKPKDIVFRPIGVIRTDHTKADKTPIQPVFAKGCTGRAEVFPEFEEGLRDLEGFSHVYLLYHMHRVEQPRMIVKPFLQDIERGVFATRAPCRPNAIGLSIVELIRREGAVLYLNGVDILDGTPLLDIKPYAARFDRIETTRNGWQDEVDEETAQRRGKRGYGEP